MNTIKKSISKASAPVNTKKVAENYFTLSFDITSDPLRHPIFGLAAFHDNIDSDEAILNKRVLVYDIIQYVDKWCVIFSKNREDLIIEDYKNLTCSFINSILNGILPSMRNINMDIFLDMVIQSKYTGEYEVAPTPKTLEVMESIMAEAGFKIE